MNDRCHPDDEAGFALLETMIALAIMAVMAGLTFLTISTNAQVVRDVALRRRAALVAQSVLDRTVAAGPDAPREGRDAGLIWTAAVTPYGGDGVLHGGVSLVTVTVTDGRVERPLIRLRTLGLSR